MSLTLRKKIDVSSLYFLFDFNTLVYIYFVIKFSSQYATKCHLSVRPTVNPSIHYTGCFIMFSVITNIYNKKTEGPTLMEFFTATGKLKKFFLTTRDIRCVHHG